MTLLGLKGCSCKKNLGTYTALDSRGCHGRNLSHATFAHEKELLAQVLEPLFAPKQELSSAQRSLSFPGLPECMAASAARTTI